MEARPEVTGQGWQAMARRGNLAQRQASPLPSTEPIDERLRTIANTDAQELWEALEADLPDAHQRTTWYLTQNESLGNQLPGEVIMSGHYRRALLALRPYLLNADCKMS